MTSLNDDHQSQPIPEYFNDATLVETMIKRSVNTELRILS